MTRVGQLASILMIVYSTILSGFFLFLPNTKSVAISPLYKFGVTVIGTHIWALLVFVISLALLYTFLHGRINGIRMLSAAMTILWIFAFTTYALNGYWLPLFLSAGPQIIFHSYLFIDSVKRKIGLIE